MTLTAHDQVTLTIKTFIRHPNADNDIIVTTLVNEGVSEQDAHMLYIFVPLAFTRFLLKDVRQIFRDTYSVFNPKTRKFQRFMLNTQHFYTLTYSLIPNVSKEAIEIIVAHCSEFRVCNEALHKGEKLENLTLSELIVINANAQPPINKRWWEVWKK